MVVIKTDVWILWQKYPISDIHESIIHLQSVSEDSHGFIVMVEILLKIFH